MDFSNSNDVYTYCIEHGLLSSESNPVLIQALTGGVSSDVVHVQAKNHSFVLKRAMPKLRVQEDWYASTERNVTERQCLERIGALMPSFVPRLLWSDSANGLFAMEYVYGPTWKSLLLAGQVDQTIARLCGSFLATIHRTTYQNPDWLQPVSDKELFYQLRISPYFIFVRDRFPHLASQINVVIEEMMSASYVLVHGDFSPKNILVYSGQPVVLDWEVGHAGHPSFDLGFMLHHLLLKAVHAKAEYSKYVSAAEQFYLTYFQEVGLIKEPEYRSVTLRTTGALMLARVDGKSKVEYMSQSGMATARVVGQVLLNEELNGFMEIKALIATLTVEST